VFLAVLFFFFFNDTATTEIYTLSLHDALPISKTRVRFKQQLQFNRCRRGGNEQTIRIVRWRTKKR